MPAFRLKLRIAWIIALAAVIFALVYLAVIPGGRVAYSTNFKSYNDFIGNLTPPERMAGNKIIGDPVYFSLRVPRRFVSAKLTLKYKVDPGAPVIEAGVLKDRATWQYDLRPVYNAKIEELASSWSVIREGETMLLQREKEFNGIGEFLKNQPEQGKIALYNYDLKNNYILSGYRAATSSRTMCRPITGTYQFYTYIKNEDLSFDFSFQDLNRNADPDPIDVYVYYNDRQIYADRLDDDGISADTGAQKPWRDLKINLANLPEGAYKIGVRANNDIVTRSIATPQSKMAFVNKINLAAAEEVSCGRDLITNSRQIQAQTVYADKMQTIKLLPLNKGEIEGVAETVTRPLSPAPSYSSPRAGGEIPSEGEEIAITEPFKQFSASAGLPEMSLIVLRNDGVMISGDGLFAFSQEQFIDPAARKIDANFDADKEGIDYVLADYAPPAKNGDWLVSTATFDLQNAFKKWNKHSFLISVPGLKAETGAGAGVTIGEIKMELTGTNIFEKIKKFLRLRK